MDVVWKSGSTPTLSCCNIKFGGIKKGTVMAKVEKIVEELALPICEKENCYVYEVEYKKEGQEQVLCLYIDSDKEGGVSIDQCETVSRALEARLDELDIIKSAYSLEVSSPGIERKLTRDWHFEKQIGRPVEVKLFRAMEGQKSIIGTLISHSGGIITVENETLGKVTIEKGKAAQVKTVFVWGSEGTK